MENQTAISNAPDKPYDDVFTYKLNSEPNLLESLKQIDKLDVFTPLEKFCGDEHKVCKFRYYSLS